MCKVKKKIDVFRAADLPKLYRDIFESYHNESDLLSELLQNAIDSIRIAKPDAPLVEIRFNVKDKVLSVKACPFKYIISFKSCISFTESILSLPSTGP